MTGDNTSRSKKETRKVLIEMASRRSSGTTDANAAVREPSGRYGSPDLSFLKNTPFVIVGGLATRLYMQERMTLDVDILVHADNESSVVEALRSCGGEQTGTLTIGGGTWILPDGLHLDVIMLSAPWVEEAIRNTRIHTDGLPYAELGYLVLMKMKASRVQDLADISRMLGQADDETLVQVRQVVSKYAEQDTEDLESLINLGRLEAGQ